MLGTVRFVWDASRLSFASSLGMVGRREPILDRDEKLYKASYYCRVSFTLFTSGPAMMTSEQNTTRLASAFSSM